MGHHYVPQRYLRNFEDPGRPGFLWLHDRRGGPARIAAIKRVAQEKGYFSAETEERLAREVEAPGNVVIRKLIEGEPIDAGERLQLAYYVGTMLKRVPARRARAAAMIPAALADTIAHLRAETLALAEEVSADPEMVARRLREIDAAGRRAEAETPPQVLELIREPWPSERIVGALLNMTWRILVPKGLQHFVTTDNPAFFFESLGLANEESELTFPLSTTRVLHGCW